MSITRLFVIDISNSIKWLAELYSLDTKVELSQRETMPHKNFLGRTLAHRTHDINFRYMDYHSIIYDACIHPVARPKQSYIWHVISRREKCYAFHRFQEMSITNKGMQ